MPHPTLSWQPTGLPVEAHLPTIGQHIRDGRLVLLAEPGAGKSTLVPLEAANVSRGRTLLLEPRRLAARATASRLAQLIGEPLGKTVGLTMRGERRVSAETRIEVMTEAVLTQRLRRDPELEGVETVIFDEFHERNLHSDLGLAMCLEISETLRDDLQLVIMSATIDPEPIARLMGDAPILNLPGRAFPVTTHHQRRPERSQWAGAVADAVSRAMSGSSGDVLVFAPGRREIGQVVAAVRALGLDTSAEIHELHGGMPAAAQASLLREDGQRRIVVATAVAETSITLPRITAVVDGGLSRRAVVDPATGFSSLITRHTTRFAADQRRGRAGRVQEGACFRLWSEEEARLLDDDVPPELVVGDAQSLAVLLADWGDPNAAELPVLDRPPLARMEHARRVLGLLGLFEEDRLTPLGKSVARLPIHPRLGALVLHGAGVGRLQQACEVAALLDDERFPESDDLEAELRRRRRDRPIVERTKQLHSIAERAGSASASKPEQIDLPALLAAAWPDRVAQRREREGSPRFLLAGGGEVELHRSSRLGASSNEFIVVGDGGVVTHAGGTRTIVRLAVPIDRATVLDLCGEHVTNDDVVEWDRRTSDVRAERQRRLGSIVFHREPLKKRPVDLAQAALAEGLRIEGLDVLEWRDGDRELRARLNWLHEQQPGEWAPVDDEALLADLEQWLDFSGCTSRSDLRRIRPGQALRNRLDWQQRNLLDELAPVERTPPGGRPKRISYETGRPVWSVRLQHLLGLDEHPTAGPHQTPITIELLTPADRPAQTTNDLPGFWRGSYAAVRADLRGRYPKHAWPEDPTVNG